MYKNTNTLLTNGFYFTEHNILNTIGYNNNQTYRFMSLFQGIMLNTNINHSNLCEVRKISHHTDD